MPNSNGKLSVTIVVLAAIIVGLGWYAHEGSVEEAAAAAAAAPAATAAAAPAAPATPDATPAPAAAPAPANQ
jgi:uncharacterized protein (UPF0333 family)